MEHLSRVQRVVIEAIATAAGHPVDTISVDQDIFELGLDSLDFWSVLMDVEDHLGEQVPSAVLDGLAAIDGDVTIGRLLEVVSTWDVAANNARPA